MVEQMNAISPDVMPGVMHCAKCQFVLIRTNLYLGNDTAGPGGNETERCPNGCGPLWPMTWRQEATRLSGALNAMFDELQSALRTPENAALQEQNARLQRCLGFFASAIKSGEGWSLTCEREYRAAIASQEPAR